MTGAPHALLRSWQQHSRAGLAASLAHQPALALVHHTRAVQDARSLLALPDGEVADDDRCAAFVVGHLNLAECQAELDWPAQARHCLLDAAAALHAWMAEAGRAADVPLLAGRHLHQLLAALALLPALPALPTLPTPATHAGDSALKLPSPSSAIDARQATGAKPSALASTAPSPPHPAAAWLH